MKATGRYITISVREFILFNLEDFFRIIVAKTPIFYYNIID